MTRDILVLLKETTSYGGEMDVSVIGAYLDIKAVEERIQRIAKANPQYQMEKLSEVHWRIGPDEDEGFFGHRPVHIYCRKAELHE